MSTQTTSYDRSMLPFMKIRSINASFPTSDAFDILGPMSPSAYSEAQEIVLRNSLKGLIGELTIYDRDCDIINVGSGEGEQKRNAHK